ncbi:MAG TPA: hypothetical protein VFM55_04905 [Micromonosporaceae bacterium]|nr:hypothetical protein [Micromonosporaceae bacterium]
MSPPALTPAGLISAGLVPAALAAVQGALEVLRLRRGHAAVAGLHPGLVVTDQEGWTPATRLVDGAALPEMLDAARLRWQAEPPAAAALAWKSYTYWLALPAVLGYVTVRQVPLLVPEDVLVRFHARQPFLTFGLRPGTRVAVPTPTRPTGLHTVTPQPADPYAGGLVPVASSAALLPALRETLLDRHLLPLLEQVRSVVNIGRRTLLGSVASGLAYAVVRTVPALPDPGRPDVTVATVHRLLDAFGVADLVELDQAPSGAVTVWRRTCCLAFTLPEPKICSGCCIRRTALAAGADLPAGH